MHQGKFKFAGVTVEINSIYPYIQKMCEKYQSDEEAKYVIQMTQELIDKERPNDGTYFPDEYLELLAVYREFLNYAYLDQVFLFHSSSFMIDGNAYLLTAPSGTGKSTHAKYLREVYQDRFVIINDDKPLIQYNENEFVVYGTPWNGKHNLDNNIHGPLKGIFVLYQNKENEIRQLSASEAMNHLFKQIYLPAGKDATSKVLQLSIQLCNKIPVYLFGCTNSVEAAYTSKKIIDEINQNKMNGEK